MAKRGPKPKKTDPYPSPVPLVSEKVPESTKSLSERTGKGEDVVEAARKCGFTDIQIENSGEERLKAILTNMPTANRYLKKEKPKKGRIPEYEKKELVFKVDVLAGTGPLRYIVQQEQRQIGGEIMRNGVGRIQRMIIDRNMVPNDRGRIVSEITIEYEKEKL